MPADVLGAKSCPPTASCTSRIVLTTSNRVVLSVRTERHVLGDESASPSNSSVPAFCHTTCFPLACRARTRLSGGLNAHRSLESTASGLSAADVVPRSQWRSSADTRPDLRAYDVGWGRARRYAIGAATRGEVQYISDRAAPSATRRWTPTHVRASASSPSARGKPAVVRMRDVADAWRSEAMLTRPVTRPRAFRPAPTRQARSARTPARPGSATFASQPLQVLARASAEAYVRPAP
jgi:hypothetical protein